jgi:hypothetical protein
VIAVVCAVIVGLVGGFQLAKWTAMTPVASGPGAATASHEHPVPAAGVPDVGGLAISAAGYTMVPEQTAFTAAVADTLRFRVVGPGGTAVTSFATVQEKQLHLVVVRRDLGGYQHLHPNLGPDGVWSTPLLLSTPGPWRAFADFSALAGNGAQTALTLGVDLTVAGSYAPAALPAPAREASVNGYVVTFEGTPRAAATLPLIFRVFRAGSPITGLEPYLGSLGHLVVLREGDAGYVHVHADPPTSTGEIKFWLTAPSAGRYRMFLDFKIGGGVQTAEYTLPVA